MTRRRPRSPWPGCPIGPGVAATLFRELANDNINVDMIVQNTSAHNVTDISFTVAKTDLDAATAACNKVQEAIGADQVTSDDNIGRVTIVGAGMKSSPGVTALMFETLYNHGINIEMISTSSIRIFLRAARPKKWPTPFDTSTRRSVSTPSDLNFRHARRHRWSHRSSRHGDARDTA